jgi:hypothetical protein
MQVVIKQKRSFGLEVFECHVNGTNAAQFMSIQAARSWARAFISRQK